MVELENDDYFIIEKKKYSNMAVSCGIIGGVLAVIFAVAYGTMLEHDAEAKDTIFPVVGLCICICIVGFAIGGSIMKGYDVSEDYKDIEKK